MERFFYEMLENKIEVIREFYQVKKELKKVNKQRDQILDKYDILKEKITATLDYDDPSDEEEPGSKFQKTQEHQEEWVLNGVKQLKQYFNYLIIKM